MEIASALAIERGKKCFYYVPSSSYFRPTWDNLLTATAPAIRSVNKTEKWVKYKGGGEISFFSCSAPDAGRGKWCDELFFDEIAFTPDAEYFWKNVMNPMLLDKDGNAWFASSPQGDNYFKQLCEIRDKDWAHFHYTTYDNPYMPKARIDAMKALLPEAAFRQEYLAEFVQYGNLFAYEFNEYQHVGDALFNKNLPIIFSFDFNIEPITCIACQYDGVKINVIDEFRIMDGTIYKICSAIKQRFGDYLPTCEVTGDPAGWARQLSTNNPTAYYYQIKEILQIGNGQIKTPHAQFGHKNSRLLLNSILHSYPITIDRGCQHLIADLKYVQASPESGMMKDGVKTKNFTHLLDCLINYLYTYHRKYIIH